MKKPNVSSWIATTEVFSGIGSVPANGDAGIDAVQLEATNSAICRRLLRAWPRTMYVQPDAA